MYSTTHSRIICHNIFQQRDTCKIVPHKKMDLDTNYHLICALFDKIKEEEEEEEEEEEKEKESLGEVEEEEESVKAEGDKVLFRILKSVIVPADQVRTVLATIADKLVSRPSKGRRWRQSYDFSPRPNQGDLTAHNVRVMAHPNTAAHCLVCARQILKGEDRCKFAALNYERRALQHVDVCYTHIYCVRCFVVLQEIMVVGEEPVCFATCVLKKGGCHRFPV
jgi:hypothetical protein